jgi:hypothetical protein
LLLDHDVWNLCTGPYFLREGLATSDMDSDLGLEVGLDMRNETYLECLPPFCSDLTFHWGDGELLAVALDVEDGGASHLIPDDACKIVSAEADRDVAKVELLLHKVAFGLIHDTLALDVDAVAVLDLENEEFLFALRARRSEGDLYIPRGPCGHLVGLRLRNECHARGYLPPVPGLGVAVIADDELLGDAHVHVVVRELESQDLLRDVEDHWVSLSLDEEVEGPVIDVVGDGSAERLRGLAAEHNVEASLLTRWYHLGERAALLQLGILVDEKPDVDVLPQVVGDDEALGRGGLDEDGLEVDLLWTSIDFLQLLASELNTAVPDFSLCLWLGFPLPLHDPVLISLPSIP